ncbi:putative microtubule associated protein [Erysiphe neolycopersici]|uniref:Putative microtubule associated protein n=1 Tax=Erysiphe neolycopersici TaxID=212602 RepID=A0A420HLI1_9PEZI|nr:putative microtubule associated protein [Erysiphe neolycopersici]
MVHAGIRGLDTPQTNIGDATYISGRHTEFDLSDEQSFHAPLNGNNILDYKLQNARRGRSNNIRTPSSRPALTDRRNLPGLGGGEFTPLLKNATRNSALRNEMRTPALLKQRDLDSIHENSSPLPTSNMNESLRNSEYLISTPATQLNVSSNISSPIMHKPPKSAKSLILHDGAKLSLRAQEEAIDKIEKENFALKLKICFLEDALKKSGPEYNEAALKENTELKVDKFTLQKELVRFRKTLHAAERDVELYRQQLIELKEKYKQNNIDDSVRVEVNELRQILEVKDKEITVMKNKSDHNENLKVKIHYLEADLRKKEQSLDDCDEIIKDLRQESLKHENKLREAEMTVNEANFKIGQLEEKAYAFDELEKSKGTIRMMESKIKEMTKEIEHTRNERQDALKGRDQAETDLQRLQEDIANKSFNTKGLNRQIEEKARRAQNEIGKLRESYSSIHEQYLEKVKETHELQAIINDLKSKSQITEQNIKERMDLVTMEKEKLIHERDSLSIKYESSLKDFHELLGKKNVLEIENDSLGRESSILQRDLEISRRKVKELEEDLEHERSSAIQNEQNSKERHQNEVNALHDKIEDIQAQLERKERMNHNEFEKWANEKRNLQAQKDMIEEKAIGLQHSINKLQEAEGTMSSKEAKLQQNLQIEIDRHHEQDAILNQQINELNKDIVSHQQNIAELQHQLTVVKEELRLGQREKKQLEEKVEALEDEVEVLQASLDEETEVYNKNITTVNEENEKLRLQIKDIKSDLAKAQLTVSNAQSETDAYRTNNENSGEKFASQLKNIEERLNRCRLEKYDLQDQLDKVKIEICSLRASKTDLETENYEIKDQLNSLQEQKEMPPCDQEKINLQSSKRKLEYEVRRLQEENRVAAAERDTAENRLEIEIKKLNDTEARLSSEIKELQKKIKGSTEKRELSIAKNKVTRLEARINELENHINGSDCTDDEDRKEISLIYRSLKESREKETEYLQREADQKSVIRGLKMKIIELERAIHNMEISRLQKTSPQSSPSIENSSLKEELVELRSELLSAHKNIKELRNQLKEAERNAQRKVNAANKELEKRLEAWEAEKDNYERSLDQAQLVKEEHQIKNSTAETTITRLREKIERLEKTLQAERLNSGENRTMALERKDLHDMLRESQSQAEALDLLVQERDQAISDLTVIENNLRNQLNLLGEERSQLQNTVSSYQAQIEQVQNQFGQAKAQWEIDRKNLTRRVRFANLSLSLNESNNKNNTSNNNDINYNEKNDKYDNVNFNESSLTWLAKQENRNLPPKLLKMKLEFDERERHHIKEMRGVSLQLEWLRAKCQREENFRAEAAFAKRFMSLQIALFEACNKADIQLLEQCGIKRPPPRPKNPISIKRIGIVLRALVRMKRGAERWAEKRKIDEKVRGQVEKQRKILLHDLASRCSKEVSNTNTTTNTTTPSNIKKKKSKGVIV